MKIRKSGANYIYREVVKNLRDYESHTPHACESDMRHDYESHMRHDFETFIQNYQRINEVETHQTLHDAIDVMQRYFMGREISPNIKILTVDDPLLQKTPVGECSSLGNDKEAQQYRKEHTQLQKDYEFQSEWCSDYLACIWCKHFRTVADPEHVWQLLSYRNYVLADMSISISNISNNKFQKEAITALHERVDAILTQLAVKSQSAVTQGKQLLKTKGMHFFWSFAITAPHSEGVII